MKKIYRMITAALALTLLLSLAGCGSGDGKTHLVFQIWDVYQRPGMEAICKAYADFGMLADVTDLYDDVDPNYYEPHFSEISRSNAMGSDGWLYGGPKDKDDQLGYWCFAYQAGGHILTASCRKLTSDDQFSG